MKKPKIKKEKYQEGLIRGKKVFLIGVFPVIIFLVTMSVGAWLITDYYNKLTINEDNHDACKIARKKYKSTLKPEYPCDYSDKGDYWLVSFDENANKGNIPAIVSFKVIKGTNEVQPAITLPQ